MSTDADMKLLVGQTIQGRYFLKDMIGQGNFGAVYRSEQEFLGMRVRRVAVKLSKQTGIDAAKAKDLFADAFALAEAMDDMTDAEARSRLVHVYDLGIAADAGDRAFVAMEFVEGTTLARQFDSFKGIVPATLLLNWTRQICQAIQGLHSLVPPVLHRDLKPDNILLGIDNNVRVVDFGLTAKMLLRGFAPGIAGTEVYMAPETTLGKSTPASDVYSIGLIVYEGLTGKHPFKHLIPPHDLPAELRSDWLCEQKSKVIAGPPSALNRTVPAELDDVVLRCLRFEPTRRFRHAGELLQALNLKPDPADLAALNEGRRLSAAGDRAGARRKFEVGLAAASSAKEIRFALLCELGETVLLMNEASAATYLLEAWGLAEKSALLIRRVDRANLLRRIAAAYRLAGNDYQANKYEKIAQDEMK